MGAKEVIYLFTDVPIDSLAEKNGLNLPSARSMSPLSLGYELHHAGLLSKAQVEIYHHLRNLRNIAVHFQNIELKEEDVKDFINLSMRLAASLRAMPHSA